MRGCEVPHGGTGGSQVRGSCVASVQFIFDSFSSPTPMGESDDVQVGVPSAPISEGRSGRPAAKASVRALVERVYAA